MMQYDDQLSIYLSNVTLASYVSLLHLPSDVMAIIFEYLTVDGLSSLSLVCKHLQDLVSNVGWALHLRSNPRTSWSLSCIARLWFPYERVRYNKISEQNWDNLMFVARPLSSPWRGKLRPSLAISKSRLVVAAGSNLEVYTFSPAPCSSESPTIKFEGTYSVTRPDTIRLHARHDITEIAFLPDNGENRRLLAGFADGFVMRVTLPDVKKDGQYTSLEFETLDIGEDPIESVTCTDIFSFSLSSSGKATLRERTGEAVSEIDVNEKGWSSFVSSTASPYVAIGTSSATPLAIYPIHESSLGSTPSVALSHIRASHPSHRASASAVYGITGPPPSFPGNPGQIIVSGWFDGRVRLYDLRSRPTWSFETNSVALLSPMITLFDPWATESIYSVSAGGGAGYTVAAGTARHSVVAFWDVRSPREGFSVHAPGNDSSPVYAVELESSRLFGATQSRPFVYDFGPGVGVGTYPQIPETPGTAPRNRRRLDDSLKTEDDVHYAVTKYRHRNPMAGG